MSAKLAFRFSILDSRLPFLALFALLAASAGGLPAADEVQGQGKGEWPLFRGNALQNGIASSGLPEQLAVRWKFQTGDAVEGAPAVVNGTAYVGSMDGFLYALDLATGQVKWKYKAAPIQAPPSVHNGAVYVGDVDGVFHCVDAATGKGRWTFATEGKIVSGTNFAGDNLLFGSYADQNLYCLSPDGKLVWKFQTQGPVNGSPAVVGDRTFVAGCDGSLHVLDTAQGKELAAVELGSAAGATAAVRDDQLYVGTMETNQVLGIDWKQGKIVWTFEAAQHQQPFYSSAAVTEDLVIVGSRDRRVHALDRKTGKEVWEFATRGKVDGSPVVVGSRVFVGSADGRLYVLDRAKGTELGKFDLGQDVSGSPAVAEGCLVIGNNAGTVYCLAEKK